MRKITFAWPLLLLALSGCQIVPIETPTPAARIEVLRIPMAGRQILFPRVTPAGAQHPRTGETGPNAARLEVVGNCLLGVTATTYYVMVWEIGFSAVPNAAGSQIMVLDANGEVFAETGVPDANVRGQEFEFDAWFFGGNIPDECKRHAKSALYVYGRNLR